MQVVVIYNLNLSLQFVSINCTFFLLWLMLQCPLNLVVLFLAVKNDIDIFHNRLLGEVAIILELFMNFTDSQSIVLESTL